MSRISRWFLKLSTAGKLLLMLTVAILPLGLVLIVAAKSGIDQANQALAGRATDQGQIAIRAVDSLVARKVLALRVAGNAAVGGDGDPCDRVKRSLSLSPNVPTDFLIQDSVGTLLCVVGDADAGERRALLVPPGQVRLWISEAKGTLYYRMGIFGGSITGSITGDQFRTALANARADTGTMLLSDGNGELRIAGAPPSASHGALVASSLNLDQRIAANQIQASVTVATQQIASVDRLIILLPVLMWMVAVLLTWLMVHLLLLGPLKRMQRAVSAHDPSSGALVLPERLGAAVEIRELGQAFVRALERIAESEHEMGRALEGQRKLVREVHHRVKNNLQVVASLLNIHRRSAVSEDAKDAYSSIGRRVDALAVVHRNHYAELEENRGIALRPLLSELAANLRGNAPKRARGIDIALDLESLISTQDVAVATAFLTTEIVEHAMLAAPDSPVMLSLHRTGPITGRFVLATGALSADQTDGSEHQQFERIVAGLAKQLRSTLDKAPGRYSLDLPIFPPREDY